MIREALDAGGRGVAVGRNAFGHAAPARMTRAIAALVHENAPIEKALALLRR